jgi:hypothetical protein
MAITEKTYKLIWGIFAGRCAICRESVVERTAGKRDSLVGEVAHIVGERKGAARGDDPMPLDERGDPDNLLLACLKDHKLIDDHPAEYPIDRLRQIRFDYLRWLENSLQKAAPWEVQLSQLSLTLTSRDSPNWLSFTGIVSTYGDTTKINLFTA